MKPSAPLPNRTLHFVIFCQVVDNFGDIGVCWRLARALHHSLGQKVTLWVDNLASFRVIEPTVIDKIVQQQVQGIEVYHWQDDAFCEALPVVFDENSVVIEAFGCHLPPWVIANIKDYRCQWINLEYLALEPWADEYHLATSPVHGCKKTFFVPGFSPRTGGLLIDESPTEEPHIAAANARSQLSALLGDLGEFANARWLSLFCYANAPIKPFMQTLEHINEPTLCLVSAGHATSAIGEALGRPLSAGTRHTIGQATLVIMPYMSQAHYDQVLSACDMNFVRGEESAVRAQLLGKPFVWQLYPQDDNAHHDKLAAFLALFLADCPPPLAEALERLFMTWNGASPLDSGSSEEFPLLPLMGEMETLWQTHCADWQKTLLKHGSLANNLFTFCAGCV